METLAHDRAMCSRLLTALLLLGLLQDAAPSIQRQVHVACPGHIPARGCPDGWKRIPSDGCVKAFMEEKTFDDAEKHCVSLGAHLASIHNGYDYRVVFCLSVETFKDSTPFWIGGYYNKEKQRYQWTDGSEFSPLTWKWTISNDENKPCLEMNFRVWGHWKNVKCDLKRPYMCTQRTG